LIWLKLITQSHRNLNFYKGKVLVFIDHLSEKKERKDLQKVWQPKDINLTKTKVKRFLREQI